VTTLSESFLEFFGVSPDDDEDYDDKPPTLEFASDKHGNLVVIATSADGRRATTVTRSKQSADDIFVILDELLEKVDNNG
jgi:hypothetical protein